MSNTKPVKLLNWYTQNQYRDTLNKNAKTIDVCNGNVCNGSLMKPIKYTNKPRPLKELQTQAKEFIDEYFTSIKRFNSDQHQQRWNEIKSSIDQRGTYDLTLTELTYGAKLAWRNAPRCIGRIQWSNLQVFDARNVTTPTEMFEAICKHMKYATNNGNLRSCITVFPQRTDGKHDFRVWNQQLLAYAGYTNLDGTITGDPINVEFTELCQKLGWKGKGGRFDYLPLLLQANGEDPEWFDIPAYLILDVKITHPNYKWFEELGLKWFAMPAVSGMMLDCGGIHFPGIPFNGWYMGTEIAARNFCDPQRYNIVKEVAERMGMDTSTNLNLWKDKVTVELNHAVLYSFQKKNVTIMDHHTASDTFMKHFENETNTRGGCPADWLWIVPPISGSITPVFHQEMTLYYLKPSYEYQVEGWKVHEWKKATAVVEAKRNKRKFTFKEIVRIVSITSKFFSKALSKRVNATILFATETGKSELYAKQLSKIFSQTFNVRVCLMSEYDFINLDHETLVLFVASTFGNGDAPANGEIFERNLTELVSGDDNIKYQIIKYAVFALGSSAYPKYCSFGNHINTLMNDLGAEQIMPVTCGDEMAGQEQTFNEWAVEIFRTACDTFCIDEVYAIKEAISLLKKNRIKSADEVRLVEVSKETDIETGLATYHNKIIKSNDVIYSKNLHAESSGRWTQHVVFKRDDSKDFMYEPGDHVAIYPANRPEIVDKIIKHMESLEEPDKPFRLEVLKQSEGSDGGKSWIPQPRFPEASIRTILMRYLDVTTPPSPNFLLFLAANAKSINEKNRLNALATDLHEYESWKYEKYPHLGEVLQEFPSIQVDKAQFLVQLPMLKPRFYSISSSPLYHKDEIHLTVAVVQYYTQDGKGPLHYGVCSNFLMDLKPGDKVEYHVRRSIGFHLPDSPTVPVILVGPGTGVAPFRSFWYERYHIFKELHEKVGKMSIYFGCRTRDLDLYSKEKEKLVKEGILTGNFLALSREKGVPKTYVQDVLVKKALSIYQQIVLENGHFYVCGDCTMAECVYNKLKSIIKDLGNMDDAEAENYVKKMKEEERYHEDIFGITLRTQEIHTQVQATRRSSLAGSILLPPRNTTRGQ